MTAYIMESGAEAERLLAQQSALPMTGQLVRTGLTMGMTALDAGCGPGGITRQIAEVVGPSGHVVGIDLSKARIEQARGSNASYPWCAFAEASITDTGLQTASFDYTWSQFVFEYLPNPAAALAELRRVTKPGGRIVVSEIDGVGMQNWPWPAELQDGFARLIRAAERTGFDIQIGRKLYSLYRAAGLVDVRVHVQALYVVAGAADARLISDWKVRFETLRPVAEAEFGSVEAYDAFSRKYLEMLEDPDGLKYSILIVTEGRVP